MKVMACLLLLAAGSVAAQTPPAASTSEMAKLDWFVGTWTGESWMAFGPGKRETAQVVEKVERKLEGLLLVVEGLGTRSGNATAAADTVHHAFGVLSFDPESKTHRFSAWRQPGGTHVDAEAKIGDRRLEWGMKVPQGQMRYIITLNDKGQWFEIGEFSRDGTTWNQFFEMTLTRTP